MRAVHELSKNHTQLGSGAEFASICSCLSDKPRLVSDIQYEKRATCNCSTVDLGEISRAFLWEMYGRKVRAVPECMQCTRVHQNSDLGWLAGARAGGFQPVILLANVGNHARAAFSL